MITVNVLSQVALSKKASKLRESEQNQLAQEAHEHKVAEQDIVAKVGTFGGENKRY
jgi:hypothetical protein